MKYSDNDELLMPTIFGISGQLCRTAMSASYLCFMRYWKPTKSLYPSYSLSCGTTGNRPTCCEQAALRWLFSGSYARTFVCQMGRNQLERCSWTGTSYSHETCSRPTGFSHPQVEQVAISSASTTHICIPVYCVQHDEDVEPSYIEAKRLLSSCWRDHRASSSCASSSTVSNEHNGDHKNTSSFLRSLTSTQSRGL